MQFENLKSKTYGSIQTWKNMPQINETSLILQIIGDLVIVIIQNTSIRKPQIHQPVRKIHSLQAIQNPQSKPSNPKQILLTTHILNNKQKKKNYFSKKAKRTKGLKIKDRLQRTKVTSAYNTI